MPLFRGPTFQVYEGGQTNTYQWLAFDQLKSTYFYPLFLKEAIFDLPKHLILRLEVE